MDKTPLVNVVPKVILHQKTHELCPCIFWEGQLPFQHPVTSIDYEKTIKGLINNTWHVFFCFLFDLCFSQVQWLVSTFVRKRVEVKIQTFWYLIQRTVQNSSTVNPSNNIATIGLGLHMNKIVRRPRDSIPPWRFVTSLNNCQDVKDFYNLVKMLYFSSAWNFLRALLDLFSSFKEDDDNILLKKLLFFFVYKLFFCGSLLSLVQGVQDQNLQK